MTAITNFDAVAAGSGASKRLSINSRYVYSEFWGPLMYTLREVGAPDCVALVSDAGINQLVDAEGNSFNVRLEQAFAGSAPQALEDANGVKFILDAASNDGFGMDLGYGAVGSEVAHTKGAFTIGTDAAFFLKVKLDIATVASTDQVAVGFAKGGWPADGLVNSYTDMACLNVDNGQLNMETRLNSAADVATDTTTNVADTGTISLEVRVSASGLVKFLVDGANPAASEITDFSFDDADVVNAFLIVLTDTTADPGIVVRSWESGFITSRGLDNINQLVG